MKLVRPVVWFAVAILLLAAAGAVGLAFTERDAAGAREADYFWAFHYWRYALDALSAACGVGLRAAPGAPGGSAAYSSTGEWTLTLIGLGGAALYLLATWQALAQAGPSLTIWRVPRAALVLLMFAAWQVLALLLALLTNAGREPATDVAQAALAAAASLGHVPSGHAAIMPGLLAGLSFVTALGWTVWLAAWPPLGKVHVRLRPALGLAGGYALWLVLLALLTVLADSPRDSGPGRGQSAAGPGTAAAESPGDRLVAGVQRTLAAAGAGIGLQPLGARDASESTRALLATAVLVGGFSATPAGGCGFLLLAWALVGMLAGGDGARGPIARWTRAGVTCVAGVLGLALVGAIGLLLIEGLAGSRFETPPTFAEAFVDAASAVGGAGLTSGLTETVTSANRVRGLGLNIDLYQVGMVWLMLLMLLGRLWPLICLGRLAETAAQAAPARIGTDAGGIVR